MEVSKCSSSWIWQCSTPRYYFKVITREEEVTDGSRGRDESKRQGLWRPCFFLYVHICVTESHVKTIWYVQKKRERGCARQLKREQRPMGKQNITDLWCFLWEKKTSICCFPSEQLWGGKKPQCLALHLNYGAQLGHRNTSGEEFIVTLDQQSVWKIVSILIFHKSF